MSVHVMREANLRDVPATLRALAERMEAGDYGQVTGCVIVWQSDRVDISYCGNGEAAPRAHLLLHCGQLQLALACLETKEP